jgi:hypothetical protein
MKKQVIKAIAFGLCLTTNVMAQVPSYVPTNGLVGWWPFNGNAQEYFSNTSPVSNNSSLTSDRFSNINSAYLFNGTSSLIKYNGSNPLDKA